MKEKSSGSTARPPQLDESHAITRPLARAALNYSHVTLPPAAVVVAKQCILDWFGVTLAGAQEEATLILASVLDSSASGKCSVIGQKTRFSACDAALINGTASHALDFDDVNKMMSGHPTVAVFPAVLAVAEAEACNGRDALAAFIAGYEIACTVGALVSPSHYAAGFHSTGTVGAIGAAAAAGLLLKLDEERMEHALGLAATQSAGLKAMFGSMAKPFHAGKAAANGVLAARLASRGFTAQPGALEQDQGFIATLSRETPRQPLIPDPGTEIVNTLFKYHAACYLTHSTIDALSQMRESLRISPRDVAAVELHVSPGHLSVCNIAEPCSGLETKFSLRHTAALAICNRDSSALATFSDGMSRDPELVRMRQRVAVFGDMPAGGAVRVALRTVAGDVHELAHNTGIVESDLARQGSRIAAKFRSLAAPLVGVDAAESLLNAVMNMENCSDSGRLLAPINQQVLAPQSQAHA